MALKPLVKTTLALTALAAASAAFAQTSNPDQALINALIQKGVLTKEDAAQITADVAKANKGYDVLTNPADGMIKKLTLSGRFQAQYEGLGTSIDGAVNPVSTERFLLRRIYLGARVDLVGNYYGVLTYDFANSSFDAAYVGWKQSDLLSIDAGLKKAPFGYEELTSSGALKAIERSPLTRYIDEPNNGRRLGASSYRIGLFASGADGILFYNVALTNPDRNEYSGDGTSGPVINAQPAVQTAASTAADNTFAYYGTVGLSDKFQGGTYKVGLEYGYVPDQGGPGAVIGQGNNITLAGAYADVTYGDFNLQAEYESAKDDNGVSATQSATPKGYWVQPSYFVIPKVLEGVVRYSSINSDHRGVALSDGIRGAPSGGSMNSMTELYVGGNWYLAGNDAKLSIGYIHGESKDKPLGGTAKATTDGVRSQMQVNF